MNNIQKSTINSTADSFGEPLNFDYTKRLRIQAKISSRIKNEQFSFVHSKEMFRNSREQKLPSFILMKWMSRFGIGSFVHCTALRSIKHKHCVQQVNDGIIVYCWKTRINVLVLWTCEQYETYRLLRCVVVVVVVAVFALVYRLIHTTSRHTNANQYLKKIFEIRTDVKL